MRFHKRLINLFMLCLRRGVRGVIYCMSVDQEVYKTNALRATQYVYYMSEVAGAVYTCTYARNEGVVVRIRDRQG